MSHKIFPQARQLEKFAWPGGYQLLYIVDDVCCLLCPACAQEEMNAATIEGEPYTATQIVNWEGPPEYCEGCSKFFESEYGDPDESEASNG
jgi:hypothetical protein